MVIPSNIIEFLIPVTIFLTALRNVTSSSSQAICEYDEPLFDGVRFGFIHGMGFSNYFRALMMDSSSIVVPLLGFNLGIEAGQLMVVVAIMLAAFLIGYDRVKHRDWNLFVSGAAAGISLVLMNDTWPW